MNSATNTPNKKIIDSAKEAVKEGKTIEPFFITKHLIFDGKNIYSTGSILEDADPYSIREMAGGLVIADNKHVWRFDKVVPGADGATFKTFGGIDGGYAKDAFRVYAESKSGYSVIEGADPSTFKVLDYAYARDSKNFYCSGKILEGIGSHFAINECGFLIGEQAVYHYSYKLPVDPSSFEVKNLEQKLKETNPFMGKFMLADKNGEYRFQSDGFHNEFQSINN